MTTRRQRRIPKLAEARVLKRRDITSDLWLMWIEKPEGYTFKPGQYCTIGLDGVERAYSIVSAPHEDSLELFFELVPEGELTPELWTLKVGDTVSIRPRAKGLFTLDPTLPKQLMVATVTGVVPYISFVRDYIHHGRQGNHLYVLQGASYHNEFAYDAELEVLAKRNPDLLTYVPTVSRPGETRNNGWAAETGRVNTIVQRHIEKLGLTPDDTMVYVCGHPGMIEDVKARLIPKGFQLKEERFWKED